MDAADAEGSTPLHELVKGWRAERKEDFQRAAMALLNAGADATAPNKQGNVPAQMASERGIPLLQLHKKSPEGGQRLCSCSRSHVCSSTPCPCTAPVSSVQLQ